MKKIIKYGLVIVKDKKFLINRKRQTELFLMPGGKPETGESAIDCLTREIREEHSSKLMNNTVKFLGDFSDQAANEPDTIVSIRLYRGEISSPPQIGTEIAEQRWFGRNDDAKILSPVIKNSILPFLIKQNII